MTNARFQNEWLSLAGEFYRVAFYILEDEAEAEDAVQELFLKLWSGRDALDGIRNPKGYGIRVLRNLCLDRIRRSRKMETPAVLPEPEWPGRQDEAVDEKERLAKVLDAIKSLPDRQREVLTLRTLDGLSYEEIAERTGMNQLTLRVLLSQARRKLRNVI
ncbi:MAG: sigma-70 family RNA polymerase sigma factor [Bacteroidales bacterium]|jgi:RNA polymerase sigma-70 factor (ECF subfamily)|nr:sigma-70 family RNA polymerase sigma factor [Bacteroidales bacterium]MCR5071025.1 sigma-70 family RNA polymerase sigma factor [Bacteroidales bacterium]